MITVGIEYVYTVYMTTFLVINSAAMMQQIYKTLGLPVFMYSLITIASLILSQTESNFTFTVT